jgi:hypothetical protein
MAKRTLPTEALGFFRRTGREGGKLGGKAAAESMTPEERTAPVSVSFDPRPAGFAGARQGKTPPPGVTDSGRPVKWSPAPATSHACSTNTRRETSAACFFPRKAGLVDVVHMHRRLKDQVAASFPALELPPIRPTTDLPKAIREPSPDSALTDS